MELTRVARASNERAEKGPYTLGEGPLKWTLDREAKYVRRATEEGLADRDC